MKKQFSNSKITVLSAILASVFLHPTPLRVYSQDHSSNTSPSTAAVVVGAEPEGTHARTQRHSDLMIAANPQNRDAKVQNLGKVPRPVPGLPMKLATEKPSQPFASTIFKHSSQQFAVPTSGSTSPIRSHSYLRRNSDDLNSKQRAYTTAAASNSSEFHRNHAALNRIPSERLVRTKRTEQAPDTTRKYSDSKVISALFSEIPIASSTDDFKSPDLASFASQHSIQKSPSTAPMTQPPRRNIKCERNEEGGSLFTCMSNTPSNEGFGAASTENAPSFSYYFHPYQYSDIAAHSGLSQVVKSSNPFDNRFMETIYESLGAMNR